MSNNDHSRSGNDASNDRNYRGDGSGEIANTGDMQADLVAPSGVNQRDHGAAEAAPVAGDMLNLDGDETLSGSKAASDPGGGGKRPS